MPRTGLINPERIELELTDGTIFTTETEMEGMEQPLHYWVPSIAACGMAFITGDRYPG